MNKPIILKNLTLSFKHKVCFEDFNAIIAPRAKIAVMGNNGTGKTTLLKTLCGLPAPSEGTVEIPAQAVISYVPQVILDMIISAGAKDLTKRLPPPWRKIPTFCF